MKILVAGVSLLPHTWGKTSHFADLSPLQQGAGFLGSNLVNHLLQQPEKHEIIILDSFTSAEEATVAHLKAHPRVKILRCDITESLSIMTLGLEVDQIYHLACPASPKWYQKDPVHTLKTCYVGTENLLKAAGRCGARILVASTSGESRFGTPPACLFWPSLPSILQVIRRGSEMY